MDCLPQMRRWSGLMLAVALPLLLIGCSRPPEPWREAKTGQKRILVSFPPLYSITHAIAGDDAYVLCLLSSTGPHEYVPSPVDMMKFSKADLVIVNGLSLDEGFMKKLIAGSSNPAVPMFDVGATIEKVDHDLLLHPEHEEEMEAKEEKGKGHKHAHTHEHGEHDPHLWLGPPQAMKMAELIAARLGELDPPNKANYAKRAADFQGKLKSLQEEGKALLKDKKNRNIVSMHESLGYLAEAFGLNVVGSLQVAPGADPDAKRLAELADRCKKENVRVIAVEPQYSKALAETLQRTMKARGVAVTLVEIDPLETAPIAAGAVNPDPGYYLRTLQANIDKLAKALP